MNELLVKMASEDMHLRVLAAPFGSPDNKDSDGEYFDSKTDFYLDKIRPMPLFYHSFNPDGTPQEKPEVIGETKGYEVDEKGVWLDIFLDDASEYAKRVWEKAKEGFARASSGTLTHLVRKDKDGHILSWPMAEISLFDMNGEMQPANQYAVAIPMLKSIYKDKGLDTPDFLEVTAEGDEQSADEKKTVGNLVVEIEIKNKNKENTMDEELKKELVSEVKDLIVDGVKTAVGAEFTARDEEKKKAETAEQEKKSMKEQIEKDVKAEFAEKYRLPNPELDVNIAKFNDLWKYDNVSDGALAMGIDILNTAAAKGKKGTSPASENMYRALAIRLSEAKDFEKQHAFKMLEHAVGKALKSDEIMYATLASYGDEWVGVEYSRDLWEKIRMETPIIAMLPQMQIPDGYESSVIPLESTDPTWYKVAEATDHTSGRPDVTVTSSQVGTGQKSVTIAKMGARVTWSGELAEDSLIRILPQIQSQMVKSGAEQLENAVINGDTDETASTNINDIAGTPAGTEVFCLTNGFRKLPLITNTDNSRSAGSHDVNDYLKTMKLLGLAGQNALSGGLDACSFIIGPAEYWDLMMEEEVKTQDVFSKATLENGNITRLWGRKLIVSNQMCAAATASLLSQAADGKIDLDTVADNVAGSILAVRWDQWKFAWKRRMTLETDRWPESDTNQLVAMVRFGLAYRDTDASAISYGVTISS